MSDRLRVVLADAERLVREVLASALNSRTGLTVVATAADGDEAVARTRQLQPDLAVLRMDLPELSGVDACRAITAAVPTVRTIVVGNPSDTDAILAAVEAGAAGYLGKEAELESFVGALHRVAEGETLLPPRMLGQVLRQLVVRRRRSTEALDRYLRLTPREREILGFLVDGCDQDSIANALVISPATARTHIHKVVAKLEVGSRAEAAALAVRQGWINPKRRVS